MKLLTKKYLSLLGLTLVTSFISLSAIATANISLMKVLVNSANATESSVTAAKYRTARISPIVHQVDYLVRLDDKRFWHERNNSRPKYSSRIDWSTDYCSFSRDTGPSFDFRIACAHHDFGYRNYKRLGLFDNTHKRYVDNVFYRDMRAHCSTRSIFLKSNCYVTALAYYKVVQKLGN
jgi:hypothetical protein